MRENDEFNERNFSQHTTPLSRVTFFFCNCEKWTNKYISLMIFYEMILINYGGEGRDEEMRNSNY